MMGPNALKILEELTVGLDLHPGMKVLDLGCGKGLTSIFLAKEFGVQVYATDLWITATENYERFKSLGLDELITPIHADATELPYAENYFDAVISVDSYHYFGIHPNLWTPSWHRMLNPAALLLWLSQVSKKNTTVICPPNSLFPGVQPTWIPSTAATGGKPYLATPVLSRSTVLPN